MERIVSSEVNALLGVIDTYKRWKQYDQKDDREYHYYHPSEWGKCLRLQQYKHYAQMGWVEVDHQEMSSQKLRLFDKGHNMHNRWSSYFDDIGGVLMGHWQCENPLCKLFDEKGILKTHNKIDVEKIYEQEPYIYKGENDAPVLKPKKCSICGYTKFKYIETPVVRDDLKIKGRADLVLNFENIDIEKFKKVKITFNKKHLPVGNDKIVGDMKTAGSNSWKNQIMAKGPHKAYLVQLTFYVHVLGCQYGLVMYENKDTSEVAWFQVKRNDAWWDLIQWQARQMVEMRNNRLLPPPKPEVKSDYECKDCPFRSLCHKSKVWTEPDLNKKRVSFYQSFL